MSHSTSTNSRQNGTTEWTPLPEIDSYSGFDQFGRGLNVSSDSERQAFIHDQQSPHRRASATRSISPIHEDYVPVSSWENAGCRSSVSSAISSISSEGRDIPLQPPTTKDPVASQSVVGLTKSHAHPPTWLPFTLRPAFLGIMATVSLVLCLTLALLCWHSERNNGLGRDNGSFALLFGWRFTPTIVAVLFAQCILMISEDIKRTEPFARMARADPVEAENTLLYVSKPWWQTIVEGFSKRKNGGSISWLLVLCSLLVGLSVLVISTLSSSLLSAEEIVIRDLVAFDQYTPKEPLKVAAQRDTYFHAQSAFAHNVTTSMWVSDRHVIFPFGPSEDNASTSKTPSMLSNGVWKTETTVFQFDSDCVPMKEVGRKVSNLTYMGEDFDRYTGDWVFSNNTERNVQSLVFSSEDGCEMELQLRTVGGGVGQESTGYSSDVLLLGGAIWTNLSASHVSWEHYLKDKDGNATIHEGEWSPLRDGAMTNFSSKCHGRDVLFVSNAWTPEDAWELEELWSPNLTTRVDLCTPSYYMATVPVTASISEALSTVSFDEQSFAENRVSVPEDLLDVGEIDNLALRGNWSAYLSIPPFDENLEGLEGVTLLLASKHGFDKMKMLENSSLSDEAMKLRGRFFTELLYSSLTNNDTSPTERSIGQSTTVDKRIVIVSEIAITLSVLFFVAFCFFNFVMWRARLRKRRLNLRMDPATTMGIAYMLQSESIVATTLRTLTQSSRKHIKNVLRQRTYYLSNKGMREELHTERRSTEIKKGHELFEDWRPLLLRKRFLSLLLLSLVALVTTLIVLHNYAQRQQLYRSAFVYQVDVGFFNAKFSPHSVVATLLAVTLGLWWDGVDKSMRRLQPYLAMSKRPTEVSKGIGLSYQSSYWLAAAFKAASNQHWLLFLITVGTTLSQIFIISMAAIFERGPSVNIQSSIVDRSLQTRQQPLLYQHNRVQRGGIARDQLDEQFKYFKTEWLHTATDQLTIDGVEPAWASNGWSFTPVYLSSNSNATIDQNIGDPSDEDAALTSSSASNTSLTTSALRAQLDCTSINMNGTSWLERVEDEFSGIQRITNDTGYLLPKVIFDDTSYNTSTFVVERRFACCTNESSESDDSAMAYWSAIDPEFFSMSDVWPSNFFVKWIHGKTAMTIYEDRASLPKENRSLIYFPEEVDWQIMNCTPRIEKANAHVVVAQNTNQILDYTLLDKPQPAPEAWELYEPKTDRNNTECARSTDGCTMGVSYGTYFMSTLLSAASLVENTAHDDEILSDMRFNIRDPANGLNLDFMSYSTYYLANKNAKALLDADTLAKHSNTVFQTFFQHFAATTTWDDGEPVAHQVLEPGEEQVEITSTSRIEILTMSDIATWLSVAILVLLMIITIVLIVVLQLVYPRSTMLRNVECLADALVLVAGSDNLLSAVHSSAMESLRNSSMRTRLGWFSDKRGMIRWGVEVDGKHTEGGDAVRWVEMPEKRITGMLVKSVTSGIGGMVR